MSATELRCRCGVVHADASRLTKIGWHAYSGGRFALLVRCRCGLALEAESLRDASQCDGCKRIITGSEGDIKVCLVRRLEAVVLCTACFRRKSKPPPPWERVSKWL